MTTVTRTRKSSKPERIARLMAIGASQVLALTQGKDTTFYSLASLGHGFGFQDLKPEP